MISFTQNRIARLVLAVSSVLPIARSAAAQHWTVASPNGSLSVTIVQAKFGDAYGSQRNLYYRVDLGKREVLPPAPLGVTMNGPHGDFTSRLTFVSQADRVIDETYPMPAGKKSIHRNHAHETTLVSENSPGKHLHVIFPGDGPGEITAEASGFRVPPRRGDSGLPATQADGELPRGDGPARAAAPLAAHRDLGSRDGVGMVQLRADPTTQPTIQLHASLHTKRAGPDGFVPGHVHRRHQDDQQRA